MRDINLIGHRGASFDAPENTLAAFRHAWEQEADGVEGDFRLTRDGEIVCLHDASTRRTAGRNLVVAEATLAELRDLDVGAWKGKQWTGEPVPTLREVIATVPPGKRLFIELKDGPEILLPLAAILAEPGLTPDQVVILSFDTEVVAQARKLLPGVKALWITSYKRDWACGRWAPTIGEVIQTLERTGASGLASQARSFIDAAFAQALRDAGMEFHVWTINNPRAAARFAALGAGSVTTNRPGWLRARLQAVREVR